MADINFNSLRDHAHEAVVQFENTAKCTALRQFLSDRNLFYPSEVEFVAKKAVLQEDETRTRAVEWLVAEKLYQLTHGGSASLAQQVPAVQAKFLYLATEALAMARRAFEDVVHPMRIADALHDRSEFEIAKQQRQEEWRNR